MVVAPSRAAVSTAAARASIPLLFACTSRILQLGQIADTMSRSSEVSPPHPWSPVGSGEVAPSWLTTFRQPLAIVHAGRPKVDRYVARSASTFGSPYASTIATVRPAPAPLG